MWSMASQPIKSSFSSGLSASSKLPTARRHGQPWLTGCLLVVSLTMSGCPLVWQRVSINETITPEAVTFITPGKTTFAEVVEMLGAPDEITTLDDESTYTPFGQQRILRAPHTMSASSHRAVTRYRFIDLKRFAVNFTWGLQFVLNAPGAPTDVELEGGGIGMDELLIVFDSSWVVQQHAFAKHADASRYRLWPFDLEPPDDNQVVSF